MTGVEFYVVTIAVFFALNSIQALGFQLQIGVSGIINLGYIMLVAIGAYGAGIAGLHPSHSTGNSYIGGFGWPFPWDVLFGVFCASICAYLLGLLVFRGLAAWYLALTLAAFAGGVLTLATTDTSLVNGETGLFGIPQFGQSLPPTAQQFAFLALAFGCLVVVTVVFWRISISPLGRVLRAVREDETLIAALGRDPYPFRMKGFVLGAVFAGLAGALTVVYLGAWNTDAWQPAESFLLVGALVIGGRGSMLGALTGSAVVLTGFGQAVLYLPSFGGPTALPSLETIVTGLLLCIFLWWRPEGIFPEQRERLVDRRRKVSRTVLVPGAGADALTMLIEPARGAATVGALGRDRPKAGQIAGSSRHAADPAATKPVLSVHGVRKAFGGVAAVDGADLEVWEGECVGIIGPNGAGKSTLFNCIAGACRADAGSITYMDTDITSLKPAEISRLGLVRSFQTSRSFNRLTVLSNVLLGSANPADETLRAALLGSYRRDSEYDQSRATALLAEFDLLDIASNYAGEVSGGQLRLVEIARILMAQPKLLLLDEPFAGIGPQNRDKLSRIFSVLRDSRVTIVLIDHRLDALAEFCDRIVVLDAGKVIASGTMSDLERNPAVIAAYIGARQ